MKNLEVHNTISYRSNKGNAKNLSDLVKNLTGKVNLEEKSPSEIT